MRLCHFRLPATGLLLAVASLGTPAKAQTPAPGPATAAVPPGLIGAWGSDSSCSGDVAVFRPDGTVVNPQAAAGTPPVTYSVNGDSITLTQGSQSGTFAFALSDQAVAWSNGSAISLKERCADQAAFAAGGHPPPATPPTAAPAQADPTAAPSLTDQIQALAGQPLSYQGGTLRIRSVQSETARKPTFTGYAAQPDPSVIGGDARLFYRIFPSPVAAADYVRLRPGQTGGFVNERHGEGFFSTAGATDEGPADRKASPVRIACLRFHPKRTLTVTITCFAQMPGSALVAGARRSFALPPGAKATDMGPKDDLTQTLALAGLAISQLRTLQSAPQP